MTKQGLLQECNIHKSIDIIYYTNRVTNQSYIIILIYAEKAFHKIKLPFTIKNTLSKLEIVGNLIKGISEKPTPNITVNDESHFYPHFYSVLMVLTSAMRQQQKRNSVVSSQSETLKPFNHIAVTTEVCLQSSTNPILFPPKICLRWNLRL